MEVGDGLPTIGTVVDDEAEPGIRDAFEFGDLPCGVEQMAEKFGIGRSGFRHARDHPLGDHEDMNGSLWGDVAEREAPAVLEDDVGGDFAGDDFFEQRHET